MPTFEELLKRYEKEIADERKNLQQIPQTQIPRDPLRRPWHFSSASVEIEEQRQEPEIKIEPEVKIFEKSKKQESTAARKQGMVHNIRQALFRSPITSFVTFTLSALVFCWGVSFWPSIYMSTVQMHAFDKTDSISSRLSLFANRPEFASFPVEFKIPLALLSRKISSEDARKWVLQKYYSDEKVVAGFNPESVRAESFYWPNYETLMIQGFANNPEAAARLTLLYWNYLESQIDDLSQAHLKKVQDWMGLTLNILEKNIQDNRQSLSDLSGASGVPFAETQKKWGEAMADAELQKSDYQRRLQELKAASKKGDVASFTTVSDPKVQELVKIYQEIDSQIRKENWAQEDKVQESLKAELSRLESQIRDVTEKNTLLYTQELVRLAESQKNLGARLGGLARHEDQLQQKRILEDDLKRKINEQEAQKASLESLRAQIDVESQISATKLKAFQLPVADEKTRRPLPLLLYTGAILLAALLTLLVVSLKQNIFGRATHE